MTPDEIIFDLKASIPETAAIQRVFPMNADFEDVIRISLVGERDLPRYSAYRVLAVIVVRETVFIQVPDMPKHAKDVANGNYYGNTIPICTVPSQVDVPKFMIGVLQSEVIDDLEMKLSSQADTISKFSGELAKADEELRKEKGKTLDLQKCNESLKRDAEGNENYRKRCDELCRDLEKLQHHYGAAAIKEVTGKK